MNPSVRLSISMVGGDFYKYWVFYSILSILNLSYVNVGGVFCYFTLLNWLSQHIKQNQCLQDIVYKFLFWLNSCAEKTNCKPLVESTDKRRHCLSVCCSFCPMVLPKIESL